MIVSYRVDIEELEDCIGEEHFFSQEVDYRSWVNCEICGMSAFDKFLSVQFKQTLYVNLEESTEEIFVGAYSRFIDQANLFDEHLFDHGGTIVDAHVSQDGQKVTFFIQYGDNDETCF